MYRCFLHTKRCRSTTTCTETQPFPNRNGIFPFLALPRELRDQVYEYALLLLRKKDTATVKKKGIIRLDPKDIELELQNQVANTPMQAHDSVSTHAYQQSCLPLTPLIPSPSTPKHHMRTALLVVNRQLYAELLPLFYKHVTFVHDRENGAAHPSRTRQRRRTLNHAI
ncbi:hypothetical protein K504DRAFT_10350 [Pleomassaria siparia CBS 279.74]|uniref:Uncharacterized protein n=1 Tax=Pleomassaria siparia CBS 279.74 TaxID=1314801 RepID=A0A6G1KR33_9PLEO|nr:hypothetical protein K504DRAFT_10350 [Pleomassaria siparia CBS 279.74]